MESIWKQRHLPDETDPGICAIFERECGISPVMAAVMARRGCASAEEAMAWLDPQWEDLHDPFLLPDMAKGVERIIEARNQHQMICIYGDYDADGTTAAAILKRYFDRIGINAFYRIPNRLKEGYGLNLSAVDALKEAGADLILTVDNGIAAFEEAARCKALGMDLIVTDHHEYQGSLPEAAAVIDAKRPDSVYPFKELCGAGIAFKLIQAVDRSLGLNSDLDEYLECAALATVADIVPLKDENRVIVRLGLEMMNNGSKNKGLAALIRISEVDRVTAGNLGFTIAPKINAAGRLGDGEKVLKLYLSEKDEEAAAMATILKNENEKRQAIEQEILEKATAAVSKETLYEEDFIIAAGKDWHSGVIGIVASRLQETWYHPVIVIGIDDEGIGKGSCRSVPGVDMFEALSSCRHLFINFGGHEMAAGFSIRAERIPELRAALAQWGIDHQVKDHCVPTYYYDMDLLPEMVDFELYDELQSCEPCGVGNPAPVFRLPVPSAQKARTMGRDRNHLSFEISGVRCVGFNMGDQLPLILQGNSSVLCRLKENRFNGNISVQPNIIALKGDPLKDNALCWQWVNQLQQEAEDQTSQLPFSVYASEHLVPEHQQIAAVYKAFESDQVTAVHFNALRDGRIPMNSFQLLVALTALKETGLLSYKLKNGVIYGKKLPSSEKKDIQKARIMIQLYHCLGVETAHH